MVEPVENPFKDQIFLHECHEKPVKNAKSQYEHTKIPSENLKSSIRHSKFQPKLKNRGSTCACFPGQMLKKQPCIIPIDINVDAWTQGRAKYYPEIIPTYQITLRESRKRITL